VDLIWALHFFEHLHGDNVVLMLRECERVLRIGGLLNICVPHRLGAMAYQDLNHKSFFTEDTWRNTMENEYYGDKSQEPWRLRVWFNVIMGINERNLALLTQMVKE
jgi:predicted SAM-dependent methyltransferase